MATIRKLPNNKFRAEIRKNQSTIKTKTFSVLQQAEDWGNELDDQITTILNIKPKKLLKLSPSKVGELGGIELFNKLGIEIQFITFDNLVTEYTKQWTGKDRNQVLRANHWSDIFGSTPIKSIKTKHIRKAVNALAKENKRNGAGQLTNKPKSPNTVIRYKAVLSAVFKYAIQQGYIKENPVADVYVKSAPNKIVRYLSDDEREALLESCKKSTWDRLHLLVMLAITTGMRKSELINLRWSDINFDNGLASLADTKNGEPRINAIPDITLMELKKFRQIGNGLVFGGTKKVNDKIVPSDRPFEFVKQWKLALSRADITNLRFHDLRHTAASYLIMNGASLKEVAEILGHKSTQTTDRYAHLSTEHKSTLVNRVMGSVLNN